MPPRRSDYRNIIYMEGILTPDTCLGVRIVTILYLCAYVCFLILISHKRIGSERPLSVALYCIDAASFNIYFRGRSWSVIRHRLLFTLGHRGEAAGRSYSLIN